ncbi:hypothetical protein [Euryhalocaulis caribicus]|uniref:hypothetical protein n=1 Tax=Euryhalocaulis caribicus TaxID=1161401 RepID=UPI0003A1B869|nr:hypothetical protein [Euryhalocaulis caribicus]
MALSNAQFADEVASLVARLNAGDITEAEFEADFKTTLDDWSGLSVSNARLAQRIVSLLGRLEAPMLFTDGPPDNGTGIDGNYAFDVTNKAFYGPKDAGDWGEPDFLMAGNDGDAATIAVGEVTTLDPGEDATVTNSGTSSAAEFDFGIPRGAGLQIDATGVYADRGDFDAEDEGFIFASTDGAAGGGGGTVLYRREGAAGNWSDVLDMFAATIAQVDGLQEILDELGASDLSEAQATTGQKFDAAREGASSGATGLENRDAINAAIAAANAVLADGLIHTNAIVRIPPGVYALSCDPADKTVIDLGANRDGLEFDARGAVLVPDATCAGKSIFDMIGSRMICGAPPHIWSPEPVNMPAAGYLMGRRLDSQAAGEHDFVNPPIVKGFFSLAGVHNAASELLSWPDPAIWNAYPDADIGAEDTFANRSTHDEEAEGFVFLSSDGADGLGGGLVIYRKASGDSANWEGPIMFHGESGDTKVRSFGYIADGYNYFDITRFTDQATSLTPNTSQPFNGVQMEGVNIRKIDYVDGWQGSGKGAAMLLINTKGHKYRGYTTSFDTCGVEIWPVNTEYSLDLSYLHSEADGQVSSIKISNKFTDNPTFFDFRHTDASTHTSLAVIDVEDLTTLNLQGSPVKVGNPDNNLFSDFSKLRGSGNSFYLPDDTYWSDPHEDFECWFYPGDGDPKHYGSLDIPEFNDAPVSFTPTVEFATNGDFSPTYSTQTGFYKQVGKIVFFNINLDFDANAYSSASGGIKILGLPAWSASYGHQTAIAGRIYNIDVVNNAYGIAGIMFSNATDAMYLSTPRDALPAGNISAANIPASTTGVIVEISGHYFVD